MCLKTKTQLQNEYVKNLKWIYMPLLKFGASNRFDIKDGQIVSLSNFSIFYSIIVMLVVDICGYFVLLETTVNNNYLIMPEFISVIEFIILNNVALMNIHFANRHSGAELVRNFIEIDAFLGIEETKFMRRISNMDVLIWCSFIASFQVALGIILILTFKVHILIYFVGAIFFYLLICTCYDNVFHVVFCKFLCLRVHYLNIALVKTAKLYKEYLIDQLLEYPFLWKKGYNDFVNSRPSADSKYFTDAFNMIFEQLQRLTKCYRFLIFCCTASLVIGTFLAVQAVIVCIKDPELPVLRTFTLTGWFVVSWTIFIGVTQQTDKFYVQIQRTKLICNYIQLKPNYSDEIFELSKSILDTLSVNDHRYSIYDLFYFNGRLLISIATSVFVYITMQLQIAFPKRNNQNKEDATS